MLAGLLAGGAALGAASALVMRRRRQQQWQEYNPSHSIEPIAADAGGKTGRTADPSMNGPVDSTTFDGVIDSTKSRP
jgi:hypothetical protein